MTDGTVGTSGGPGGTGGRLPRLLVAAAALGTLVQVSVNALSDLSDDPRLSPGLAWGVELSSGLAILLLLPWLWFVAGALAPWRRRWPVALAGHLGASVAFSLAHIALMTAMRFGLWGGWYDPGPIARLLVYEYRKDAWTYALLTLLLTLARWLGRPAPAPTAAPAATPRQPARVLVVQDGARRLHLPVEEVASVEAAGNYVELLWNGQRVLHRATLSAVAAELGPDMVRIHRSRLVARAAIRAVETNQAGDFAVTLADGTVLKGSRRYRDGLAAPPSNGHGAGV